MQLALTPDEAAFREELRTVYTTKIPADIRERTRQGSERALGSSRDQLNALVDQVSDYDVVTL
jgi:hypothetical protein